MCKLGRVHTVDFNFSVVTKKMANRKKKPGLKLNVAEEPPPVQV